MDERCLTDPFGRGAHTSKLRHTIITIQPEPPSHEMTRFVRRSPPILALLALAATSLFWGAGGHHAVGVLHHQPVVDGESYSLLRQLS